MALGTSELMIVSLIQMLKDILFDNVTFMCVCVWHFMCTLYERVNT